MKTYGTPVPKTTIARAGQIWIRKHDGKEFTLIRKVSADLYHLSDLYGYEHIAVTHDGLFFDYVLDEARA